MSFEERVKITQDLALKLLEHPDVPLNISDDAISFFDLYLIDYHGKCIPQCSVLIFEYLSLVFNDNPSLTPKNIGDFVDHLIEDLKRIPDVNRPKTETDLENKIKKVSGFFLARVLIEMWRTDLDKRLDLSEDDFIKYLVLVGTEFSMIFKEIVTSYSYDVHGNIPAKYRPRLSHSKRYYRTYLCLQCGRIFFSKSNNAEYCPDCIPVRRMEKQRQRRGSCDRQERCSYCNSLLPIGKGRPKKYCDDNCRYAARKKEC